MNLGTQISMLVWQMEMEHKTKQHFDVANKTTVQVVDTMVLWLRTGYTESHRT